MLTKNKKEEIIKKLSKAIKESVSVTFVNFHGLNVGEESILRRDLRNQGVNYKVSRKTLLKRVLTGVATGEMPALPGEVAVAYLSKNEGNSVDEIAPAREIYNFQKTHKGLLEILGGIFEGKFINVEKMTEIATIPSREVLLSKIAFLLKSPMQRLAIAVNEVGKIKK